MRGPEKSAASTALAMVIAPATPASIIENFFNVFGTISKTSNKNNL
jgi:hypothetical protein